MLDLVWILDSKLLLIASSRQNIISVGPISALRQVRLLSVCQAVRSSFLLLADRVCGPLVELVVVAQLLEVSRAGLCLSCPVEV